MEENPFNKKQEITYSLTEVLPIEKSRGVTIYKKEQIRDVVEEPLVKACEIFWDKNIKTCETSANNKDIENGFAWMRIDFDSLSDENKKIALKYEKPHNDNGKLVLEIDIPITKIDTVVNISDKAVEIADNFQKQKASWIYGTTLNEQLDFFEKRYGKNYPEEIEKEKKRLTQPGAWEEECKRLGKYFDADTLTAYESEEWYKKAKESSEMKD